MEDTPEAIAAECGKYGITEKQWSVLQLRLQGNSVEAVAKATGVGARTIYRWQAEDANYIAARNVRVQEVHDSVDTLLLSGMTDAADRVLTSIRICNNTRSAVELLKAFGFYKQRGRGPTTPDAVQHELDLDRREKELKAREQELAKLEEKLTRQIRERKREPVQAAAHVADSPASTASAVA